MTTPLMLQNNPDRELAAALNLKCCATIGELTVACRQCGTCDACADKAAAAVAKENGAEHTLSFSSSLEPHLLAPRLSASESLSKAEVLAWFCNNKAQFEQVVNVSAGETVESRWKFISQRIAARLLCLRWQQRRREFFATPYPSLSHSTLSPFLTTFFHPLNVHRPSNCKPKY